MMKIIPPADLPWIPAFAGMTREEKLFSCHSGRSGAETRNPRNVIMTGKKPMMKIIPPADLPWIPAFAGMT